MGALNETLPCSLYCFYVLWQCNMSLFLVVSWMAYSWTLHACACRCLILTSQTLSHPTQTSRIHKGISSNVHHVKLAFTLKSQSKSIPWRQQNLPKTWCPHAKREKRDNVHLKWADVFVWSKYVLLNPLTFVETSKTIRVKELMYSAEKENFLTDANNMSCMQIIQR